MLDFRPITKESISLLMGYIRSHSGRFCDYTPVNLYIWKEYFYKSYAVYKDMLYMQLCGDNGDIVYAVPMGDGDLREALLTLKNHTYETGETLCLSLVSEAHLPLITDVFGETVEVTSDREWCDYLYDAPRMAAFEGAAYAKQRNHVRRFERQYPDYRVEWLSPSHVPLIDAFLNRFADIRQKKDELAFEEIERTRNALANMTELSLFGVVLYVKDELVGFSAGCHVDDTLFVNFEKADTTYEGVYQMLVKSFACAFVDETIRYINREEDCGDEGLRKSKLAYHPIELLEKYNVLIK
ncbi:MAG: DUF2156 domain-containing protein [Clostridia bacterium]|nr:DUF2156 domain-containing protein [Clostridia bacterium]